MGSALHDGLRLEDNLAVTDDDIEADVFGLVLVFELVGVLLHALDKAVKFEVGDIFAEVLLCGNIFVKDASLVAVTVL